MSMQIESGYVKANGIRIYFETVADAQVLFISGSGADLRNKPNQFDSPLAELGLLAYDQRGLGQTEQPAGEYSMAQYADDAAGLLDALGLDSIAVVGVSFGGMVAQEFALRHPQRIKKLVLACTSSGGKGGASYPLHELQGMAPRERAVTHLRIADLRHTDEWIAANPSEWERRIELTMGARRTDSASRGATQQLEARRYHDTFDRLQALRVPVLLVGGRYDGIAPPSNLEAMHREIPGSELGFFEGGHMFLIQDKHAYPHICAWLRNNGAGSCDD